MKVILRQLHLSFVKRFSSLGDSKCIGTMALHYYNILEPQAVSFVEWLSTMREFIVVTARWNPDIYIYIYINVYYNTIILLK